MADGEAPLAPIIYAGMSGTAGGLTLPFPYDHARPDYVTAFAHRAEMFGRLRAATTRELLSLKAFYRDHPVQFIADWGISYDPRNVDIGLPSLLPLIPFPRQIDWCDWILDRWRARERGLTEKSRSSGMTWIGIGMSCALCLFHRGMQIGWGSRKAEYIEIAGGPKAIFFRTLIFLRHLPPAFRAGWDENRDARQLRMMFPETEASMSGESGDSIGRGDRTTIYFVDEAAHIEQPEQIEASLSATTNCRIDISTPNGIDNPFYERRNSLPARQLFSFHFRDDPRLSPEWESKIRASVAPAIFEQEYNLGYSEGGAFFQESSLLVRDDKDESIAPEKRPFVPVAMPRYIDCVFFDVDTAVKAGKEHDGLAVTFWGISLHGTTPHKLYVLDWDYTQLTSDLLITWLPQVFQTANALATECQARAGSIGGWIEDKGAGTVLLAQAERAGWLAQKGQPTIGFANPGYVARAIDSKLTSLGKVERAINASGPVHRGDVKFTERAFNRTVNFKGVDKNHQWTQVIGFRTGVKENPADDLLDTFTYGVAIALGNSEGF